MRILIIYTKQNIYPKCYTLPVILEDVPKQVTVILDNGIPAQGDCLVLRKWWKQAWHCMKLCKRLQLPKRMARKGRWTLRKLYWCHQGRFTLQNYSQYYWSCASIISFLAIREGLGVLWQYFMVTTFATNMQCLHGRQAPCCIVYNQHFGIHSLVKDFLNIWLNLSWGNGASTTFEQVVSCSMVSPCVILSLWVLLARSTEEGCDGGVPDGLEPQRVPGYYSVWLFSACAYKARW